MDTFLQFWGGIFYLLNKVFFWLSEKSNDKNKRLLKISAWIVYLIGLPAWVIIFIFERNWIAASIEAGGAPAMIMGIIIAIKGKDSKPKWLDYICLVAVGLGTAFSFYDFGGITTINQILEIIMVAGFLIGTYLLAKENPKGYCWFMPMNASNTALMLVQGYYVLMVQQILSLFFVVDAYRTNKRRNKKPN